MRWPLGSLAFLALLVASSTASAHAVLERAAPPLDTNVAVGTDGFELVFTERLAQRYTDAHVFDMNGTNVKRGEVAFDPRAPDRIRVGVIPLENGIFSVAWRTMSADGHTSRGTFFVSVGNATLIPSGSITNLDSFSLDNPPSVGESVARTIFFVGLLLAAGWTAFILFIDAQPASTALLRAASAQALVGSAAGFFGLAYLGQRTGLDVGALLATTIGLSIVLRGGLLLLVGLLALFAASRPDAERRGWTLAIAFTMGTALVATSLGSHAAAARHGAAWAVASDMAHLLAGAIWAGGATGFLVVLRARRPQALHGMMLRFAPLALASVLVLGITGTISGAIHLDKLHQLWSTPYGRLVAAKAILLVPVAGIGVYGQRSLAAQMVGAPAPGARRFRRAITVQALGLATILVAAGVLATSASPTSPAETAAEPTLAFELTAVTETTHVVFRVDPAPPRVGNQTFTIQLHALTLGGIPNGTTVAIKFAAPGEPEPAAQFDAESAGPGVWRLEGTHLTTAGTWHVLVLMQRPDDQTKLTFEVPVEPAGTAPR